MKLSTRIRIARNRAGISQAELAQIVKVGRSAVANWESAAGGTAPSSARLSKIAVATGVSFEWLATGRGSASVDADEVPAADAELVYDPIERRLLAGFRSSTEQLRQAILVIAESRLAPPRKPPSA